MENKQPIFSILSGNQEEGVIEIVCDKNDLINSEWLFNNIPWVNHSNKIASVKFEEPIELFYVNLNGHDTQSAKVEKINFDNVLITAMHGFAGNSYSFNFKLGDETILYLDDYRKFDYEIEKLKEKYIGLLESKIKGLKWQMSYAEKAIDNFKKTFE
jgi:hypothetical protein